MITGTMRRNCAAVLTLLLFISSFLPLIAQESDPGFDTPGPVEINRVLGDQYLTISLGLQLPLFIHNPNPGDGEVAINQTNLRPGLSGGLGWAAFLNNEISLGLNVNAAYSADLNGSGFFAVPILVNGAYYLRTSPIEVPLNLGLGLNIMRYKDITTVGMIVTGGVSVYWNAIEDWSFGVNIQYWWQPEFYGAGSDIPASMTRFGNSLQITASALYNF